MLHPKVAIQFPAAALGVILAYVLKQVFHVDEPVEIVAAQTSIITFLASYLVPGPTNATGSTSGGTA